MSDQYNYWAPELPKGHPMRPLEESLCENLCCYGDYSEGRKDDPDYEALKWIRKMYTLEAWIKKAPNRLIDGMILDTLKLVREKDDE